MDGVPSIEIKRLLPEPKMKKTERNILDLADTMGRMSILRISPAKKLARMRAEYRESKMQDAQAAYFHGGHVGEVVWALFGGKDTFALRPVLQRFWVTSQPEHSLKYAEEWATPQDKERKKRVDTVKRRLAGKLGVTEADVERSGFMDPIVLRFKDTVNDRIQPTMGGYYRTNAGQGLRIEDLTDSSIQEIEELTGLQLPRQENK